MTLLLTKLREISVFIYTLIFLLIFNLYFNFNYTWDGISLIVRIYLLVFSFYLVFIFASLDLKHYIDEYAEKYGRKWKIFLFIETRLIPFLFILLITILFTLIDYIRVSDWPWNPILSLLNGRYSNNIIYSWLLLIILSLKKKPSITIPIFLSIMLIYGMLDKMYYSIFESGVAISGIKLLKLIIFFSFLFIEFFSLFKTLAVSVILSLFFYLSAFVSFSIISNFSKTSSYENREAGLILIKMGYTFPVDKLKKEIMNSYDYDLMRELLSLMKKNNIDINFSEKEWENLLLSSSVKMADLVSKQIMNNNYNLSYIRMVEFAKKKARDESSDLENADNFIKLFSKYYKNNEDDFIERLKKSKRRFKIWGIKILKENRNADSIPLLLNYLTDIDETIADNAYDALKTITDMDPASALDKKINDPDIIGIFKKYYIKHNNL